ncbi:helix-turn-helix domain-containing protein [Escherichia coli]
MWITIAPFVTSALSRQHGLASRTLNNAFERHYPRAEKIIADALETTPEAIWPERYTSRSAKKDR